MPIVSPKLMLRGLVALAAGSLLVAACRPSTTVSVTQRPTVNPTATAAATTAAKATTAPTTAAKATRAPATAAGKATPTAQPSTGGALSTPIAAGTELAMPIGNGERVGNLMITPMKAEQTTTAGTQQPKAGDQFEVVTVRVVNLSATASESLDPAAFVLVNPAGGANISLTMVSSMTDALKAATLQPNQSVTGAIVFEVPANSTANAWELMYHDTTHTNSALWSLGG
jgi:hypothetical protein